MIYKRSAYPRLVNLYQSEGRKCNDKNNLLMIQNIRAQKPSMVEDVSRIVFAWLILKQITNLYWWCRMNSMKPTISRSVLLIFKEIHQSNCEELYHAARQWPKTHCQEQRASSGKTWKDWDRSSQSPNLKPTEQHFTCWKRDWNGKPTNN